MITLALELFNNDDKVVAFSNIEKMNGCFGPAKFMLRRSTIHKYLQGNINGFAVAGVAALIRPYYLKISAGQVKHT
jgi:cellulose synthase/poly-beta-1,6-N-acetylglucosamine synthase-like glycosyltransferase